MDAQKKELRRGRNIFCVGQVYRPALSHSFTEFQLTTLDAISARPEFDYWVTWACSPTEYDEPRKPGPFYIMHYNKSHRLVCIKIGKQKILREYTTGGK